MTADWRQTTPCRTSDPEKWFPAGNLTNQQARELCLDCPILRACGDHALLLDEFGVWGGMTRTYRRRIQKRRGIIPVLWAGQKPQRARLPVKALELLAESDRLRAEGMTILAIAAQFGISDAYLREARARASRHLAEVAP